MLDYTKKYQIKFQDHSTKALKKLSNQYPKIKMTRFIADLLKQKDVLVSLENTTSVIERYTRILQGILDNDLKTEEQKFKKKLPKSDMIKILCRGLEELKTIENHLMFMAKNEHSG